MNPDMTTERGRAQAYANGGMQAWLAAKIEQALKSDDRDRQHAASEVLANTSTDIMTEGRQEYLHDLIQQLVYAAVGEDSDGQDEKWKAINDLLATMRREQLIMNDMLGLVQAHLDGHETAVDLKGAIAKVREKYRETD